MGYTINSLHNNDVGWEKMKTNERVQIAYRAKNKSRYTQAQAVRIRRGLWIVEEGENVTPEDIIMTRIATVSSKKEAEKILREYVHGNKIKVKE